MMERVRVQRIDLARARDMETIEFERARSRRVPVAMMVIFIMFLTMGFDLEADWFAGQRGANRYRYQSRMLYDGDEATRKFSTELDKLEGVHEMQQNKPVVSVVTTSRGGLNETMVESRGVDSGAGSALVAKPLVTDIAKSYRGKWCMESIDREVQLYPDAFDSPCGTVGLKLTTGLERRINATLTYATLVLQNEARTSEASVKMHGEFKTHKNHLLLISATNQMFRKNKPPKEDGKSRVRYAPYSPCKIRLYFKVSNSTSVEEDGMAVDLLALDGMMESENCGWKLHMNATSLNMDQTISKVTNYCFMMVAIAILQLVCLVHQVQQVANPGVSLLSLGQQAMIDAYLCLLHLTAGIVADSMFSALATAAFCEFVVFSMFEMRYLIACSHSRLGNQNNWFEAQADIGTIYGRFYGLLLAGIVLVYEFRESYWVFTFFFYSFWIPQIVRNAVHAYRRPLKPLFIIGMSLCRLMLPLYFFGYPNNFLKIPYSPRMCFSLILYVGAQVVLLLLQYYKGSRCFIPKIFLPEQYNYYRKLNTSQSSEFHAKAEEEGGLDCVICMTPIDFTCPSKRMVTPCNHFFHPECLERWLKVKMECPTCRRVLPPSEY